MYQVSVIVPTATNLNLKCRVAGKFGADRTRGSMAHVVLTAAALTLQLAGQCENALARE
ncbi:MAG: hypothetical protein QOH35_5395 [Acidobacteriaceae bacterium]|nr:hypothetical protein [Acidobacteriaceae bacterium]